MRVLGRSGLFAPGTEEAAEPSRSQLEASTRSPPATKRQLLPSVSRPPAPVPSFRPPARQRRAAVGRAGARGISSPGGVCLSAVSRVWRPHSHRRGGSEFHVGLVEASTRASGRHPFTPKQWKFLLRGCLPGFLRDPGRRRPAGAARGQALTSHKAWRRGPHLRAGRKKGALVGSHPAHSGRSGLDL